MRRFVIAAVTVLPVSLSAQGLPPVAAVARIADSLAQAFVGHEAPSVAIALVRGRDTITMRAWGKADLEQDVAATPRSVYRIGSVTKQFTSAAVMQLVEQGKVKLDDSIAAYLPTLPVAWRPITVRELLNHTSGIPSYTGIGAAWQRRWGEEMTPDTLVALTASMPMWFAPGTSWRYDNSGYVVLGMLIEKITGHPWGTDIAERFAKPLGLEDTWNCLVTPIIPRRARGYEPSGNSWINTPYLAMSQPYSAGAMCSTVGDLAKWNRSLNTGHVVSAASYALMTTPTGAASASHYGFGLAQDTIAGRTMIAHGGGINGFTTGNAWVPSAELSITVLANSGSANSDELVKQLARAALGAPLAQPPKFLPFTAADRSLFARYVGVYALALPNGARDFTIAEEGDHLTAQLAGQPAIPILRIGDNTFGVTFDPNLRLIFTVDGARATKVTLLQGGQTFVGPRK
jgi:CubicO group peptidase (beta-lactamase class C family)